MSLSSLRRSVREMLRHLLRTTQAAHLVGMAVALAVTRIDRGAKPGAISALVFSAFRFTQDIEVMAAHPRLRLFAISPRVVEFVHAVFSEPGHEGASDYYMEEDPVLLALRARRRSYIGVIARYLRLRGIDCAMTPSIQYKLEQDWAGGLDAAGMPFIGLHKEFTVIDERHLAERITTHRNRRQKFLGSALLVTNQTARSLFAGADVFPAEKIHIMGLLRMDRLFAGSGAFRQRQAQRKQAVLFSFGHFNGGLGSNRRRSHYFSLDDSEGFVQLFRDVHAAFAELAMRHPDVDFLIKPKNVEDWWIREIADTVQVQTGTAFDAIPNLKISAVTAPELIRDAHVVVGFNSTVLLESMVLNRNTVVPVFAEAKTKYPGNVYLSKYLDLFAVADSREHFMALVEQGLNDPDAFRPKDASRLSEMMTHYLGSDDGRALERLVGLLDRLLGGKSDYDRKTI